MSGEEEDTTEGTGVENEAARTAELEVLREENRRLRDEYARARQSQYRRTALVLGVIGVLAAFAGVAFPATRTVLFALGGTGVFVGVLTYYLSPEQFLPASVGRNVYDALAKNEAALTAELGLSDEFVYVPTGEGPVDTRLFVPQHAGYEVPEESSLEDMFVVTDSGRERGVSLQPTGAPLAAEIQQALPDGFGGDAPTLATQLAEALVEQFELVTGADTEVYTESGRTTVAVTDSSYGPIDRFDHPVVSVLAVGLAHGLNRPITAGVETVDSDRADYTVTCRWELSE